MSTWFLFISRVYASRRRITKLNTTRRVCGIARVAAGISLCAILLIAPFGCAAGAAGSDLVATPKPRPIGSATGGVLRIPQDEPFSILFSPSQRQPGLGGAATAEANAVKDGSASASVSVDNAGSANATFQVGHAFLNDTSRQVDLAFRVRLEYACELECKPAAKAPIASASLWLYTRDVRGRILGRYNLAQHNADDGAGSSSDHSDLQFTQTLGPGDSVSVFVAGTAMAEFEGEHTARVAVTIKNLTLEASTQTAPSAAPHAGP